jgi:hypothetical protein
MSESNYITSDEFKRAFEMLCSTAKENTRQNKKLTEYQIEQKHQIKQIQETQANYKTIAIGLLFSILSLAGFGAFTVLNPEQSTDTEEDKEATQLTASVKNDKNP